MSNTPTKERGVFKEAHARKALKYLEAAVKHDGMSGSFDDNIQKAKTHLNRLGRQGTKYSKRNKADVDAFFDYFNFT